MLLKKTILWSCWACHPGRPGNFIICPTPATVSAELRLGACWNGWSCYLWPCSRRIVTVGGHSSSAGSHLARAETPSPGHKSPTPFLHHLQQKKGQQSLHFPHCLGRPTGPWVLLSVHSLLSSLFSKPVGSIASLNLSLPLWFWPSCFPLIWTLWSYQAQIEKPRIISDLKIPTAVIAPPMFLLPYNNTFMLWG